MSKLLNICMLLLILALICPASLPAQASAEPDISLLQFTGGGHVLGFSENGVYAATGDHALKVEFVNGLMVQPMAESASNGQNMASPLDKVSYNGVWKDIDITYTSAANGIAESTYYLNTPASVDSIRLRYNRPVSLDGLGNLVISFENGNMTESAPMAWQNIEGTRKAVSANYVIYGEKEVGFALADYQPGMPVVIDPVLAWNILFGTGGETLGASIAADASGNLYVTGQSFATWGSPISPYIGSGEPNLFLARFNSGGTLVWNTFIGGSSYDSGYGVATDSAGNVYVTGESYGHIGWNDAIVAKFNSSGALQWTTYLGSGAGVDAGLGIAVDASNNIFISGRSTYTWGTPIRPFNTTTLGNTDAFVAKLNSSGALQWNTFLGGDGNDDSRKLKLDSSGNIYILGTSDATWQGDSAPRRGFTTPTDYNTYVAKINNSGVLQWNTFLAGASDRVTPGGLGLDSSGNIFVSGYGFATWESPLQPFVGTDSNAFVAKLNNSGDIIWNTFLGSASGLTWCMGLAVTSSGDPCICGMSTATWGSPWLPYTGDPSPFHTNAFVARLSGSGALDWNAFLGGDNAAMAYDIALDPGQNICFTGPWNMTFGGSDSSFVAKVSGPAPTITSFTPASGGNGTRVTIKGTNLFGATSVRFGSTAAKSFTVNSDTQITAIVGTGATGKVTVRTLAGTAISTTNFNFDSQISTTPHGSSMSGITATTPQGPVSLPSVSVKSASLSATKVAPGTPVTVTADVANTGTVNGTGNIKVYVNGELENSQGVTVNSGSSTPVTFTVTRSEPGTYSVYVGGASAGSFTVDTFADPNTILYISGALLVFAFIIGLIFISRRRQAGH